MVNKQYKVAFNEAQYAEYQELVRRGITKQSFPQFAKSAYNDYVLNLKQQFNLVNRDNAKAEMTE